jgi:PemK-like, MazF-like toxin of type II toxin-antitoxin system
MARIKISRGEIWRVKFPFQEDATKGKYRPCLILGFSELGANMDQKVWLMPFFSFEDGGTPKENDFYIKNFKAFNLNEGSYLRTARIASVDFNLISEGSFIGEADSELLDIAYTAIGKNLTR